MHPDIIAEIPGVKLESDYKKTVVPALQLEEEPIVDMAKRDEGVRKNFDRVNNFHKTHDQIKGMDDIIEIYSDSDSDYDDDRYYIPRTVKIEYSNSRDDRSEVDQDKNWYDVLIEDVNGGEETKYHCLGRVHRIRTQTTTDYFPSWNNKPYPKGDFKGVNLT